MTTRISLPLLLAAAVIPWAAGCGGGPIAPARAGGEAGPAVATEVVTIREAAEEVVEVAEERVEIAEEHRKGRREVAEEAVEIVEEVVREPKTGDHAHGGPAVTTTVVPKESEPFAEPAIEVFRLRHIEPHELVPLIYTLDPQPRGSGRYFDEPNVGSLPTVSVPGWPQWARMPRAMAARVRIGTDEKRDLLFVRGDPAMIGAIREIVEAVDRPDVEPVTLHGKRVVPTRADVRRAQPVLSALGLPISLAVTAGEASLVVLGTADDREFAHVMSVLGAIEQE